MFGAWVTTNVSQRIVGLLVQLPAPVTFNMSQLGVIRGRGDSLPQRDAFCSNTA